MSEDIETLKQQLQEKENELNEVFGTFSEIKTAYETLNLSLQKKELELQALKSNQSMKETQIETLNSIVKSKDDQIKTLTETLKMKDSQVDSINETLALKEKEIESIKEDSSSNIDESAIKAKDDEIAKLKEEIKLLNLDLKDVDREVIELQDQLKALKESAGSSKGKSGGKAGEINCSTVNKEQIIDFMIEMVGRALHNVNITTPDILDLAELQLYDVKGTVNVKASCYVDIGNEEHSELLQEFDALDNISLRNFDEQDRWICLKDNEEMFIAAIGENDSNLAFFSNDSKHIKIFNSLITESWLRARKI